MRYVAKLLIMTFIMLLSRNVNFGELHSSALQEERPGKWTDSAVKIAGDGEPKVAELEVGESVDGHFGGIRDEHESHYYKITVPDNLRNEWIGVWIANYADSSVNCQLLDKNGWVLNRELGISRNARRLFQVKDTGFGDNGIFCGLWPGRTYYIKVEKQFYSVGGRYILSVFSFGQ